jgi:hypothetical protein
MPDFHANGVVFKSADEFFYAEQSGMKPNTLRTVTMGEANHIFSTANITIERAARPRERFTRTISTVFDVTKFYPNNSLDRTLIVCWEAEA